MRNRFVAIIAGANIVIFICCYMISSYSILSKDFPTVTETFIEYCRKYPFCTCCYFHRKGKIAKKKPANAPSVVVVKHKYFNMNSENHIINEIMCKCVFCQTEWHIVKYLYTTADGS